MINWQALLRGELLMTFNIVLGLVIGDVIMRYGFADRVMSRFLPALNRLGIGPVLAASLTVSVGSSKAGAALLAKALEEGRMTREGALWGTISLSFPAYLKRWPSTLVLCVSMSALRQHDGDGGPDLRRDPAPAEPRAFSRRDLEGKGRGARGVRLRRGAEAEP